MESSLSYQDFIIFRFQRGHYTFQQEKDGQILTQKDYIFQATIDFLTNSNLPSLARMEVLTCAGDLYDFLDDDPLILETLLELLEKDYFRWGDGPSEHSVVPTLVSLGDILDQPEYCLLWRTTLNRLIQDPELAPIAVEMKKYWDRVGCEPPIRE